MLGFRLSPDTRMGGNLVLRENASPFSNQQEVASPFSQRLEITNYFPFSVLWRFQYEERSGYVTSFPRHA